MANLCFGLVMPLIIGLMMSEFFFYWSVVIEGCEIWFSVWDWQDTDLVGCLMNCIMSMRNVFAERILHFRYLKIGSALLALMHLFTLVISFLFIPEHCGWTHCPHLLQLIQSILFCFRLLVFLIIADSVSGWFLLHMWHTQLQSSELHVLHCPVNIIRVNQQSVDKWREINNWYAN